jgi:hypothetical protein
MPRCFLDVRKEDEVVMIGNRDRGETFLSASENQLLGIGLSLSFSHSVGAVPGSVSRGMDLKITLIEMCAFIHD